MDWMWEGVGAWVLTLKCWLFQCNDRQSFPVIASQGWGGEVGWGGRGRADRGWGSGAFLITIHFLAAGPHPSIPTHLLYIATAFSISQFYTSLSIILILKPWDEHDHILETP